MNRTAIGILASAKDESRFWKNQDIQLLAQALGRWNREIAASVGHYKDQIGGDFVAPIAEYLNFEHLEPQCRTRVRRRHPKAPHDDGPGLEGVRRTRWR